MRDLWTPARKNWLRSLREEPETWWPTAYMTLVLIAAYAFITWIENQ
jgi:hypothetical protein